MSPGVVDAVLAIFPVFAGMVPEAVAAATEKRNFPRIRGDGPGCQAQANYYAQFSPYSRGWSHTNPVARH